MGDALMPAPLTRGVLKSQEGGGWWHEPITWLRAPLSLLRPPPIAKCPPLAPHPGGCIVRGVPYGTSVDEKDVPIVIAENYSIACWSWIALRGPVEIELNEVLRGGGGDQEVGLLGGGASAEGGLV
jgi:hypothetical protein